MDWIYEENIYGSCDLLEDFTFFQRACLEGRSEEVKDTLALGLVDLNKADKGPKFLPLVLATFSSSAETVFEVLDGGINSGAALRSAYQLASHKGYQHITDVIKNFVSRASLKIYTDMFDMSAPLLLSNFHRFVCDTNVHPVRIVINVLKYQLNTHLENVFNLLNMMYKDEMGRGNANETRGFKYFFLALVVSELSRFDAYAKKFFNHVDYSPSDCEIAIFYFVNCYHSTKGKDSVMLKLFRCCLRDFKFTNSDIYKTLLKNASLNRHNNERYAIRDTILGPRSESFKARECICCGNLFANYKCPHCNEIYFCSEPCRIYYSKIHDDECNGVDKKTVQDAPEKLHDKISDVNYDDIMAATNGPDAGDSSENKNNLKTNDKDANSGDGIEVGVAAAVGQKASSSTDIKDSKAIAGGDATNVTHKTDHLSSTKNIKKDERRVPLSKRVAFSDAKHSTPKPHTLNSRNTKKF